MAEPAVATAAPDPIEGIISGGLGEYGATPRAPPAGPPEDIEAYIGRQFAPHVTTRQFEAPRDESLPRWTHGDQALDAFLLGGWKPLRSSKSEPRERLEAAKAQYEHENGPASVGLNMLGTTAAIIPLIMGGEAGLVAPAGRAIASMAPKLAPVLDFLGGSGGGGLLGRMGSQGARGAAEGAAAGGLQSGMSDEPLGTQVARGAALGGGLGAAVGGPGAALRSWLEPAVAQAESGLRAAAPKAALRPGQLPGASPVLQAMDRLFSRGMNGPQREALTEAVTKQAGMPERHLTKDWVDRADALNGGEMSRVAGAHSIDAADPHTITDLHVLDSDAHGELTAPAYEKFQKLTRMMDKDWNTGSVPGSVYQSWTQRGGLLDRFAKDPDLRPFVGRLRSTIDDAWERAIAGSGSPEDMAAWRTARRQYKNTRSIDESLDPATGQLNLGKLFREVEKRSGGNINRAGAMGDLAIGGKYMAPGEKPPGTVAGVHMTPAKLGLGALALEGLHSLGIGEHVMHAMTSPAVGVPAAVSMGAGLALGKGANALATGPMARHIIGVASGAKAPLTRGVNPLVPGAVYLGQGAGQ